MHIQVINSQKTMTSREIAELTGKDHKNVLADVRKMLADLGSAENTANLPDAYGRPQPVILLDKEQSLCLVAGYSAPLRMAIIRRWQDLEAKQVPAIPQTFAQALRLAAEQQEVIEQQQAKLLLAAPAVAFVDRYVEAKSAKNLSDVAKILGWKPQAFIARLAEEKIIFKRSGSWVPFKQHIDCGRFTVKTGESNGHAFHQTRVEPKGIEWLAAKFG